MKLHESSLHMSTVECEVSAIRLSTFDSNAMLDRKKMRPVESDTINWVVQPLNCRLQRNSRYLKWHFFHGKTGNLSPPTAFDRNETRKHFRILTILHLKIN